MTRPTPRSVRRDALIETAELLAYEKYGLAPKSRRIKVDTGYGQTDIRIVEFGAGEGLEPVLLFHGICSVNVIAAPLIQALQGRHVIAVDWPGHGLSGPCVLPAEASPRVHVRAVMSSILDSLELGTVDFVGHSLGAQFSLYTSLDLADRVRSLTLLGAPGAALPGAQPVAAMKLMAIPVLGAALLSLPMTKAIFRQVNAGMLGPGVISAAGPEVERAAHALAGRRSNARSIASFFRCLLRRGQIRDGVALTLEELGRIRHSVLMLWGDLDVFQTPTGAADAIARFSHLDVVRVPTAGHVPWLPEDETVTEALLAHLADASVPEPDSLPENITAS